MAESKPMTTAEKNAAAMKRMDEAKPTPTQEENDLATGASKETIAKRAEERKQAEEESKETLTAQSVPAYPPLDEDTVRRNEEAMERMDSAVPTPTQAEVDAHVENLGKPADEQEESGNGKPPKPARAKEAKPVSPAPVYHTRAAEPVKAPE